MQVLQSTLIQYSREGLWSFFNPATTVIFIYVFWLFKTIHLLINVIPGLFGFYFRFFSNKFYRNNEVASRIQTQIVEIETLRESIITSSRMYRQHPPKSKSSHSLLVSEFASYYDDLSISESADNMHLLALSVHTKILLKNTILILLSFIILWIRLIRIRPIYKSKTLWQPLAIIRFIFVWWHFK